MTADEVAGYAWLAGHAAPGSLVLALPSSGNRIPRYADCRVWAGHFCQTLDYNARAHDAELCFTAALPDPERAAFVAASRADYIFMGPAERHAGVFDPGRLAGAVPVFQQGEVTVYRLGAR